MKTEGKILAEVREADLREALQTETDPKALKRLVAALEYKSGTSPATITEKYGWSTQTVYKWLYRFAERGGEAALYDAAKPGRPSRLSEAQKQQYREAVLAPPSEVELDAPAWTPALLGEYLEREIEVRYSNEHCRRLLHEAGLSVQTARPTHYKADRRKQTQWREEFKKSGRSTGGTDTESSS